MSRVVRSCRSKAGCRRSTFDEVIKGMAIPTLNQAHFSGFCRRGELSFTNNFRGGCCPVVFTCHRAITVFSALFRVLFLLVLDRLFSMLRQLKDVESQSLCHLPAAYPAMLLLRQTWRARRIGWQTVGSPPVHVDSASTSGSGLGVTQN